MFPNTAPDKIHFAYSDNFTLYFALTAKDGAF